MYKIGCRDIGIDSCGYEATGNTPDQVADQLMNHAKSAHSGDWQKMREDKSKDEMVKEMKTKMREE